MERSVVTDTDRRMQNSRCAVCAVIKLRAGMEGLPQARRKEEPTEKVPITAFLSIFSVTLFKNYRKRTLKILRSEVFQWPRHWTERSEGSGWSDSGTPDSLFFAKQKATRKIKSKLVICSNKKCIADLQKACYILGMEVMENVL